MVYPISRFRVFFFCTLIVVTGMFLGVIFCCITILKEKSISGVPQEEHVNNSFKEEDYGFAMFGDENGERKLFRVEGNCRCCLEEKNDTSRRFVAGRIISKCVDHLIVFFALIFVGQEVNRKTNQELQKECSRVCSSMDDWDNAEDKEILMNVELPRVTEVVGFAKVKCSCKCKTGDQEITDKFNLKEGTVNCEYMELKKAFPLSNMKALYDDTLFSGVVAMKGKSTFIKEYGRPYCDGFKQINHLYDDSFLNCELDYESVFCETET